MEVLPPDKRLHGAPDEPFGFTQYLGAKSKGTRGLEPRLADCVNDSSSKGLQVENRQEEAQDSSCLFQRSAPSGKETFALQLGEMVRPTFWASPLPNGGVCYQGKKEGGGAESGQYSGWKDGEQEMGLFAAKRCRPPRLPGLPARAKGGGGIHAGGAHGRNSRAPFLLRPVMPDGSLAPIEKITFHVAFHLSLILLTFPSGVEWMVLIQLLICWSFFV